MDSSFVHSEIEEYCRAHTSDQASYLQELEAWTAHKPASHMISGFYQGRILALLSKLLAPKKILDIGTYTGFSALCLAEGLVESGELITIDSDDQYLTEFEQTLGRSPHGSKIRFLHAHAEDVLSDLEGPFDLVFLDAAKKKYQLYMDLLDSKIPTGGILVADNVLWKGKVLQQDMSDARAQALDSFNKYVLQHPRYESIMLPIRDGLLVARKIQ